MRRSIAIMLLLAMRVAAQDGLPRSVEIFGQIGRMRMGGDEGAGPGVAAYGGTIVLPFKTNWAVDLPVALGHPQPFHEPPSYFGLRRTLVSPAVIRRFGVRRIYGFAGLGLGLQSDRTVSQFASYAGSPPEQVGVVRVKRAYSGMMLVGRGGAVWNPWSHLLVRGDAEVAFRYVIPNLIARIGVGWRF